MSAVSGLAPSIAAPALAAQEISATVAEREFSTGPAPLDDALLRIQRAFDVDVVGADQLVAGKRSSVVSGASFVEQALAQALYGTGLTYSRSQTGAFVIAQGPAQAAPPRAGEEASSRLTTDTVIVTGLRAERSSTALGLDASA